MTKNDQDLTNEEIADAIIQDQKVLIDQLKYKLCFNKQENLWYIWNEITFWNKTTPIEVLNLIENTLFEQANFLQQRLKNSRKMANDFKNRLCSVLVLGKYVKDEILGISFINGFYCFKTKILYPHQPKRFIIDVVPQYYNEKEQLTKESRKFLYDITKKNFKSLALIRLLVYLILNPSSNYHVGFLFYGGAGTGKSTLCHWLSLLVGDKGQTFELNQLKNAFVRSQITQKTLIFFHEVLDLNLVQIRWLKTLVGRDKISGEKKYVQGDFGKVFSGTVILTSNGIPTESIFLEPALSDRFLGIPFFPSTGPKDPLLFEKLSSNISGLINWGNSFPPEFLKNFVRVADLNTEFILKNDELVEFCENRLGYAENSFVDISSVHSEYVKERLKEDSQFKIKKNVWRKKVLDILTKYFECNTSLIRKRFSDNKRAYVFTNINFLPNSNRFQLKKKMIDNKDWILMAGLDIKEETEE